MRRWTISLIGVAAVVACQQAAPTFWSGAAAGKAGGGTTADDGATAPSPSGRAGTASSSSSSSSSSSGSTSSGGRDDGPAPADCPTGDPFDPAALRADVTYLASPELGGRAPGTAGEAAARGLVEARFRCFGLEPGGANGAFQQPFVDRGGKSTANVIGVLRGTDRAAEIIVVGAHHDHFGDVPGEGVLLGANDNASGVTGMLAIAQHVAKQGPSRRTLVFASFGSEEPEPYLQGSDTFVRQGGAAGVVYMLNLDMVGSYAQQSQVYALGSVGQTPATSILRGLVGSEQGLRVTLNEPGEGSDFEPFCVQGIPYVFFWTPDDRCYHEACDTAEKLDYAHMGQIARLGAKLAIELGQTTTDLAGFRKTARPSQVGCPSQ